MKARLGFLAFLTGTAFAAAYAARAVTGQSGGERLSAWFAAAGWPFLAALLLMSAGAVVMRRERKSGDKKARAGGHDSARDALDAVARAFAELPDPVAERAAVVHAGLDEILERLVPEFLEYREQLIGTMGLFDFAHMIGNFASFERNVARAWSALTDEAFDEAHRALAKAGQALERVQKEIL